MAGLPDRAPPELAPGVTVADLATVEDCDRALDGLTMAIAQIERQLKATPRKSPNQPAGWRANAEAALRIKKYLMPRVQERRADVKRQARLDRHNATVESVRVSGQTKRQVLLSIVREIAPEVMSRADRLAQERFPELFTDGATA